MLAGATAAPCSIGTPSNPSCGLGAAAELLVELVCELVEADPDPEEEDDADVDDELDELLLPQAASNIDPRTTNRTQPRWTRIERKR
ncbi:MAG TPA: hypothetical protein VGF93_06940 [Solirubrobacteraceae bacterium]